LLVFICVNFAHVPNIKKKHSIFEQSEERFAFHQSIMLYQLSFIIYYILFTFSRPRNLPWLLSSRVFLFYCTSYIAQFKYKENSILYITFNIRIAQCLFMIAFPQTHRAAKQTGWWWSARPGAKAWTCRARWTPIRRPKGSGGSSTIRARRSTSARNGTYPTALSACSGTRPSPTWTMARCRVGRPTGSATSPCRAYFKWLPPVSIFHFTYHI